MINRQMRIALLSICLLCIVPSIHTMDDPAPTAPLDINSFIAHPRLYIEREPIESLTPAQETIIRAAWSADHPFLHRILKTNTRTTELTKALTDETINSGTPITYFNSEGKKSIHLGIIVAIKNRNFDNELTEFLGITPIEECTHNCAQRNNDPLHDPSLALILQCTCTQKSAFTINSAFIPTAKDITTYCTYKDDIFSSIDLTTSRRLRQTCKTFLPRDIVKKEFFIIKNAQGNKLMICTFDYYTNPWTYNQYPLANICLIDLTQSFRIRTFYENRIPLVQLALLAAIHKERKPKPNPQKTNKLMELTLKEQTTFDNLWPEIKNAITPCIVPHESTLTSFQKFTRLLTTTLYNLIQINESKSS